MSSTFWKMLFQYRTMHRRIANQRRELRNMEKALDRFWKFYYNTVTKQEQEESNNAKFKC
jgi:hypothetical protein